MMSLMGKRYLWILFPLIITFSSCGDKGLISPLKAPTSKPNSLLLLENGCLDEDVYSPALAEVSKFIDEYDAGISAINQQHKLTMSTVGQSFDHFKSSPQAPHIMGEKKILEGLARVKERYYQLKAAAKVSAREGKELGQSLKRLHGVAMRWHAQKCSVDTLLEARDKDIRTYLRLKEKVSTFACDNIKCKEEMYDSLFGEDRQLLLNLCNRYKSKGFCAGEMHLAEKKNQREKFLTITMSEERVSIATSFT